MADSVQTIPVPEALPRPLRLPRALVLVLRFCRRKPLGAIGAVIVVSLIVLAAFADRIAPHSYDDAIRGARMKSPSVQFWMGTDNLGRDIWSRVVYGARISVTIGFATVALATFRSDPILRTTELVRLSRLSVMPLTPAHLERIEKLAGA